MRVGSYTVDQSARTVTFQADAVILEPGEALHFPGTPRIAGNSVTYDLDNLPPSLEITV